MKPGQTSPQLIRASNGSDDPSEQTYLPNKIRLVQLKRRGAAPLGFSIRGGREHGTGVFVSQVSGGSEAHHRGLRVGDQIIRINGYPIDHFIHEEVLALLKARPTILLKVKSVGMIPIKDNKRDPITWKMVEPDPCSSGSDGTHSVSSGSSLDEPIETKVFISGIGGSSLGCSVVKGPPELPGIFVQTVKLHGLAEIAGLEIGDQITEVNGQGFLNVEFSEAIAMLKSCKEMALTVRKGAGLELFPEERLRRRNVRLCNGHAKGRNGNGHLLNGNHTMHNRTLYTNGNNGKASPESFHSLHDTITNGSLSEMSDRSTSLSSSQSTSPVTNGYTTHPNGNGCQKHRSTENGGSHYGSSNSHVLLHPKLSLAGSEERQRLEEEKRRLYEKEQLLKMEAEKLAEERRKLEVQKSLQEHHQQIPCLPIVAPPCNIPAPPQMHVFAELHSVAQQRRMSREKGLQNGTEGSRKAARTGLRPDAKPSPDVLIKQKQHEQLMVEFREVHKKMFGMLPSGSADHTALHHSQIDGELSKSAAMLNIQEAVPAEERDPFQGEDQHAEEVNGKSPTPQPSLLTSEAESVDTLRSASPSTVQALKKERTGTPAVATAAPAAPSPVKAEVARHSGKGPAPRPPGSKDVPITDSRGPEPKPPKSFFGPRPLVTIGSYPDGSNPRPNRFSRPANKVEIVDSDRGTTTVDSSNKRTESRSASPPRTKTPSQAPEGNTGPKMTVSINCKAPTRPSLSTRFNLNGASQAAANAFSNEVDEGTVVKTLTFKKDGPLNLNLEGGLNSVHDGRIIVTEVREGGLIPVDGDIASGDQILMVNNTRLVNVSLTAARVAMQNAMGSESRELRLTVAKQPQQ